ncbi:Poly(rC)-binding protein 3-like isoform X2 [Oopsacas minuta]|uniref:Poly(RC)-binding protein 3-like isoform X2 n=1 Tax=Oopsacas minuta TaxID=111878 RepID=A0AAV7JAR7_9METZ|nr:Poly(rC)-binding protein 3-like isoform X2 [Oopsacas minuta]
MAQIFNEAPTVNTEVTEDIYQLLGLAPLNELEIAVRLLMPGKDVGSIIGKAGAHIKLVRDMSHSKINISDNTTAERLVTINGFPDSVLKAVNLMAVKLEKDSMAVPNQTGMGTPPLPGVSFNLPFPSTQCGSFIGKSGANIKDIRETTSTSIQVAGECLPGSSERIICIQGNPEGVTKVIYHVCSVLIEHPIRHDVDLYEPDRSPIPQSSPPVGGPWMSSSYKDVGYRSHQHSYGPYSPPNRAHGRFTRGTRGFPPIRPEHSPNIQDRLVNIGRVYKQHGDPHNTHIMYIPNDLIGCIIGKAGQKINEIRTLSGATIKISDPIGDQLERTVTISGPLESIGVAQYHINCRLHEDSRRGSYQS